MTQIGLDDGWDHAGRTVGRRRHDAAACRILLGHGHRIDVHPVQYGERVIGALHHVLHEGIRSTSNPEGTGQDLRLAHAALDGGVHHLPDLVEPAVHLLGGAVNALVLVHQLGNGQIVVSGDLHQLVARTIGIGLRLYALKRLGRYRLLGIILSGGHDKAAAHGVVTASIEERVAREHRKLHGIGVKDGNLVRMKGDVDLRIERHRMHTVELQLTGGSNVANQHGHLVRIHGFGNASQKSQLCRCVRAVPLACRGETSHQLDLERRCLLKHPAIPEHLDQGMPRTHRSHRMRRRGADAHLEHVENTDCHF